MSAFQKIAVIGATGLIGKPVVKQLANAGFDLTLISRDASKVKAAFPSLNNAKTVQADPSDPSALKKAFTGNASRNARADYTGIDAVVSLVGAPALTEQKAYIDAAVEAGVKRFIPSEFGCDTQAPYL
jgi:nucleoside-diphosphate-sugar epimerase